MKYLNLLDMEEIGNLFDYSNKLLLVSSFLRALVMHSHYLNDYNNSKMSRAFLYKYTNIKEYVVCTTKVESLK